MMRKLLVLLGVVAVFGYVSQAEAKDRWPNWYLGLKGSTGFALDDGAGSFDYEGGWGLGATLGYLPEFGLGAADNFRLEAELFYRENEFEGASDISEVESISYMFNTYYDFQIKDMPIVPYIGAGLGTTKIDADVVDPALPDLDDTAFTWQLMGGLSFEIEEVPMVAFNVGYRFVRWEDNDATDEASNHNLEVGVDFRF